MSTESFSNLAMSDEQHNSKPDVSLRCDDTSASCSISCLDVNQNVEYTNVCHSSLAERRDEADGSSNNNPHRCVVCHSISGCDEKLHQRPSVVMRQLATTNICRIIMTQEGRQLQCIICQKLFNCKEGVRRHMRKHTGEKPYECTVCGRRCSMPYLLSRHMRTHTGEKPFECTVCGRRFSMSCILKRHSRIHTGQELSKPAVFKQKFKRSSNFKTRRTFPKSFECKVCGHRFTVAYSLYRHMRTHTGEKPFECTVCGSRFSMLCDLKRHSRIHSVEKLFECALCECKFRLSSSFKKHMMMHKGLKPFKSAVCTQKFKPSYSFKAQIALPTNCKPFECTVCGNRFTVTSSLCRHTRLRSHYGEKPFGCAVCGRRFSMLCHLKRHSRTHSDEKLFECAVCQCKFQLSTSLDKHMIMHKRAKPFKSAVCKQRFKQSDNFSAQTMSTTDKKPFQCTVCGHQFTVVYSLYRHMRSHTGGKPFKAAGCKRRFRPSSNCKAQTAVLTDYKPFECTVCGERYSEFNSHSIICSNQLISTKNLQQNLTNEEPYICIECGKGLCSLAQLNFHTMRHMGVKPFFCNLCHRDFWTRKNLMRHKVINCSGRLNQVESGEVRQHDQLVGEHDQVDDIAESSGGNVCSEDELQLLAVELLSQLDQSPAEMDTDAHAVQKAETIDNTKISNVASGAQVFLSIGDPATNGDNTTQTTAATVSSGAVGHMKVKTSRGKRRPGVMHVDGNVGNVVVTDAGKQVECHICQKLFRDNYQLRRHLRTHTGEKPFECTECGKRITTSSHLRSHMTLHTGKKPFECTECGKGFTVSSRLRSHMRLHTGEKPFECPSCEYRCCSSSTLYKHMRFHSREKQFECTLCIQRYINLRELKTHMKTAHAGKMPLELSLCG